MTVVGFFFFSADRVAVLARLGLADRVAVLVRLGLADRVAVLVRLGLAVAAGAVLITVRNGLVVGGRRRR